MIASLGMYDRAETAAANDRFWTAIRNGLRDRGIAAPEELTRGEAAYWPAWQDPTLVLSQTCGYPFRARLYPSVTLIASPDYGLPDCPSGHYNSVFIARADDPRATLPAFADARFAFNEDLSQSGWAAPVTHLTGLGLRPRPFLRSGSHRLSALAVAESRADYAAIDSVTWGLIRQFDRFADALRELGRTTPTPALPFISGPNADRPATLAALRDAVAGLTAEDRATLRLQGVVEIPSATYLAVPSPPDPPHFGMQN